jgi:3-dehydroquinate synthase
VITDLVGFVASIYMRGISYVNIPTTLIAQLDAAIGGKTAINLSSAKNIVGAFHHPKLVLIDPLILETLPVIEIRHGLAEAIKVSMISSGDLFTFIESHLDEALQKKTAVLEFIILQSIQLKLNLLERDPYERNLQRVLNFGHTFGHALETAMGYNGIHHGEAISIGMMVETKLAYKRGVCDNDIVQRLETLLLRAGLPISFSNDSLPEVYRSLREIALVRGNHLNVVLPVDIGNAVVESEIQTDELLSVFK